MLIAYSMPTVNNIALYGGTWLTSDGWRALTDGRPSRAARIQRSGTVTLTVSMNNAIIPGVIALLGLNIPAGTTITAVGASAITHALPDGTACAWLLPKTINTTPTNLITVAIEGASMLNIGELAIMPAIDVPIEPDWSIELIDPTESTRDRGSQIATAARVPYRRLTARLQAQGAATARTWEHLRMALTRDQRAIAIPRHGDALSLHHTAAYGVGRIGVISHLGGNWFSAPLTLDELPATP